MSGIGPSLELSALGIPLVHDLPGVGKNLQDHLAMPMLSRVSSDFSDRWKYDASPELQETARKQWDEDRSGLLAYRHGSIATAFIKLPDLYETSEFKQLDAETQRHLREEAVPHYELTGVSYAICSPKSSVSIDLTFYPPL